MNPKPLSRRALMGAAGSVGVAALAGCAGANMGGTDGPNPSSGTGAVSTTVPDGPVTLNLSFVDDPPTKALVEGFSSKFSTVTIDAKQTPFADYVKTIKLSMASNTPPDLAEYNAGAMRSLVPAKKVLSLDAYAEAYGWDDKFPASSLQILKSDAAAEEYGTGSLYAVPGALSVVGVFYHKKTLQKVGASEAPTDLAAFEQDMDKVKKSGLTPLSVGALEANGIHLWCSLVNVIADLDAYLGWAYGRKGASIEGDSFVQATSTMQDWMKKGYIPAGANATSSSDALADFVNGKSAYHITGNWAAATVDSGLGDDAGFFLLPQQSSSRPPAASGASVAFCISAATKQPDAAAAFLDYLASAEAAQIEYDGGFMPVNAKATIDDPKQGLKAHIAQDFAKVLDGAGIIPFPDIASPGMLDKLTSGVQGVLSGHTTPADMLASLQSEWDQYHAS